ncbi:hypothetical protein BDZ90DRAFT_75629 [Jaminaea rosea]|uniref:Uncharacterized protein n=1 Tax=Jaminaea rosea TaxID=1569628 RepID=A0A316UNE8_9BASI|nr:hypothetical protein BDZ90DRAFT_75629 [Jaminaea rosea]PWN25443.1 hypothetical protein BDZ90DRAFT_75629 [Jaminaea rosea]
MPLLTPRRSRRTTARSASAHRAMSKPSQRPRSNVAPPRRQPSRTSRTKKRVDRPRRRPSSTASRTARAPTSSKACSVTSPSFLSWPSSRRSFERPPRVSTAVSRMSSSSSTGMARAKTSTRPQQRSSTESIARASSLREVVTTLGLMSHAITTSRANRLRAPDLRVLAPLRLPSACSSTGSIARLTSMCRLPRGWSTTGSASPNASRASWLISSRPSKPSCVTSTPAAKRQLVLSGRAWKPPLRSAATSPPLSTAAPACLPSTSKTSFTAASASVRALGAPSTAAGQYMAPDGTHSTRQRRQRTASATWSDRQCTTGKLARTRRTSCCHSFSSTALTQRQSATSCPSGSRSSSVSSARTNSTARCLLPALRTDCLSSPV